jgi:hypothetical protein
VPADLVDEQTLEAVEVFVSRPADAPADTAPADAEQPNTAAAVEPAAMPATVGALVDEVAAIVPGKNTRTRKAATDRLRDLWQFTRAERWSNLPCQPNGMYVGALIIERQEWLKKAKLGTTVEESPRIEPCPPQYANGLPPEAHPFDAPAGDAPAGDLAAA